MTLFKTRSVRVQIFYGTYSNFSLALIYIRSIIDKLTFF